MEETLHEIKAMLELLCIIGGMLIIPAAIYLVQIALKITNYFIKKGNKDD